MSKIFGKIFLRNIGIKLNRTTKGLMSEFSEIRDEFDEHLQAINENTNEIAASYEHICEIEEKLDRLSARVEQIQMYLETGNNLARATNFEVRKLTRREQEVFLVIYTLEEEKSSVTYDDIARRLGISIELAGSYVTALIEKGVPIIKRYINSKPYLKLDPDFKTLQTKENILQVSLEEFGF